MSKYEDAVQLIRDLVGDKCPFTRMEDCWYCGCDFNEDIKSHARFCAYREAVEFLETEDSK